MHTEAIVLQQPGVIALDELKLVEPGPDDAIVDMIWSGISTGTERLFWQGRMPWFPGLGYPLVPGYEGVGEVVSAPGGSGLAPGDRVFVPGANCYADARGLFGASAARVVVPARRVTKVAEQLGDRATLLSLAATAQHAIAASPHSGPALIVGHGALGRLIARLLIARGDPAPTVWEVAAGRFSGALGYEVVAPAADDADRRYATVFEVSGSVQVVDQVVQRIAHGGEIVLAGFYAEPLSIAFPPAFMREARMRIAAEWTPADLSTVEAHLDADRLSLDGLISHRSAASDATTAYRVAFDDPSCTKMILSWRTTQ
ncbi:MAG: chlorophyll synthesis pathway protein BchC [Hyphomicrobiaceae bacterium]